MERHTVTVKELDDWLRKEGWAQFAANYGDGSSKSFDVDPAAGVYRVRDHGKTVFLGTDKMAAIAAYNDAL